jgi:hypothetical protein
MKTVPELISRWLDMGLFFLCCAIYLGGIALLAPVSGPLGKIPGLCATVMLVVAATFLSASHRLALRQQRRKQIIEARNIEERQIQKLIKLAFRYGMSDVALPTGEYALLHNSMKWRRGEYDLPPDTHPPHLP